MDNFYAPVVQETSFCCQLLSRRNIRKVVPNVIIEFCFVSVLIVLLEYDHKTKYLVTISTLENSITQTYTKTGLIIGIQFEVITMATAASVEDMSTKVIEEGLTCCLCYELLKEPKVLECPHVFCLECLQKWVKKKPRIECPECRYVTVVPQGGLGNLKTNLHVKTMVDNYVKGVDKEKGMPMCPNHWGATAFLLCHLWH